MALERLQKIIARAGLASRRRAEELISSGLVTVNGQTITEMGSKADPEKDHIKVSGKLLQPPSDKKIYLLLNKPPEVVSTMSDPEGRRSLLNLLHGVSDRVFPVGRLEYHAMGAVFLTNDGDLANRMLRSHRLPQTYQLKLKTLLTFDEIEKLSRTTHARITRMKGKEMPWYEVSMPEASDDALRNRLFQTGHYVEKMRRVAIANLHIGALGPGEHRELTGAEIAALSQILAGNSAELAKLQAKRKMTPRPVSKKKLFASAHSAKVARSDKRGPVATRDSSARPGKRGPLVERRPVARRERRSK